MPPRPAKNIGSSPTPRENRILVQGQGRYTDDVDLQNPIHVSFVRSQIATGKILDIDLTDAIAGDHVVAAYDGRDVADLGQLSVNPVIPITNLPNFPVLTWPDIKALGQPVAAVLAKSHSAAQLASENVFVDFKETEFSPEVVAEKSWTTGDTGHAFDTAAHVIHCDVQHPRLAPSPMEPRAISVAYHADTNTVTVWHSTQTPHRTRSELAMILGIDADRIRVIATHVGGAFGMKASLYPEDVFVVWAAFKHKNDVKWAASRSEEFLSATHGRGLTSHGALALDAEGHFLGLKAAIKAPIGPWVPNSGLISAWNGARILPSGYKIAALDLKTQAETTPHGPTGIYRGAGRPEANLLMERLIDKAARVTGIDPIELRCKNLLAPQDLPHRKVTGDILDSGDYASALYRLKQKAGYDALLKERNQDRAMGKLSGVGIGFYLEPSGNGWETATVTTQTDGTVLVASGSSSQGHGRETAFAQIAADALGCNLNDVTVVLADTDKTPNGIGALASRSTAIGGSAVFQACTEVAEKKRAGIALPITVQTRYENKGQAWGYGAYITAMEIDRETGVPTLHQTTCMDDAGIVVNPDLVAGQITGGFAQGLGEALMEKIVYDKTGQLLTGSFMDYAMPRAKDVPSLQIEKTQTPSQMNLLGAKGVGEAGTIGAPIAILNAAIDALSPLGVTDLQMPITSETLWRAIQDAEKESEA